MPGRSATRRRYALTHTGTVHVYTYTRTVNWVRVARDNVGERIFGDTLPLFSSGPEETMPTLTILTNLEKSAIPEKFVEEATELFAQAIGKAKQVWIRRNTWLMVSYLASKKHTTIIK